MELKKVKKQNFWSGAIILINYDYCPANRLFNSIVLLSEVCFKIVNSAYCMSSLHRTTSRRSFPLMENSKWSICRWTGSSHTCPRATLTWSLRLLRRPRRPSNTWMEVGHSVCLSTSVSQDYSGRMCWITLYDYFVIQRPDWWTGNHCICRADSASPSCTS